METTTVYRVRGNIEVTQGLGFRLPFLAFHARLGRVGYSVYGVSARIFDYKPFEEKQWVEETLDP